MTMIQHQCPRFHLYHAPEGQDSGCPVCAAQDAELPRTRGVWDGASPDPEATVEPGAVPPDVVIFALDAMVGGIVGRTADSSCAIHTAISPRPRWAHA